MATPSLSNPSTELTIGGPKPNWFRRALKRINNFRINHPYWFALALGAGVTVLAAIALGVMIFVPPLTPAFLVGGVAFAAHLGLVGGAAIASYAGASVIGAAVMGGLSALGLKVGSAVITLGRMLGNKIKLSLTRLRTKGEDKDDSFEYKKIKKEVKKGMPFTKKLSFKSKSLIPGPTQVIGVSAFGGQPTLSPMMSAGKIGVPSKDQEKDQVKATAKKGADEAKLKKILEEAQARAAKERAKKAKADEKNQAKVGVEAKPKEKVEVKAKPEPKAEAQAQAQAEEPQAEASKAQVKASPALKATSQKKEKEFDESQKGRAAPFKSYIKESSKLLALKQKQEQEQVRAAREKEQQAIEAKAQVDKVKEDRAKYLETKKPYKDALHDYHANRHSIVAHFQTVLGLLNRMPVKQNDPSFSEAKDEIHTGITKILRNFSTDPLNGIDTLDLHIQALEDKKAPPVQGLEDEKASPEGDISKRNDMIAGMRHKMNTIRTILDSAPYKNVHATIKQLEDAVKPHLSGNTSTLFSKTAKQAVKLPVYEQFNRVSVLGN